MEWIVHQVDHQFFGIDWDKMILFDDNIYKWLWHIMMKKGNFGAQL